MRTPPSLPEGGSPDRDAVSAVVESVLFEGRTILTEPKAQAVLAACGIPTVPTRVAANPAEALEAAEELVAEGAVSFVVKILSRDITHKSDVGGVHLRLSTPAEVEQAALDITETVERDRPDARIEGFVVQPMVERRGGVELIVGLNDDQVFGPVILFGAGGTAVEVVDDKALALPPLDPLLARDMIESMRIGRLLGGYRDTPPMDRDAVGDAPITLSTLGADFPQIREIDINPLLVDIEGVIALDARIVVGDAASVAPGGNPRFAIRPRPSTWVREAAIKGGTVTIHAIRPADEALYADLIAGLTQQDVHFRFFGGLDSHDHRSSARLTQIDHAREDGLAELHGSVMDRNDAMRRLALDLGFAETDDAKDRSLQRFTLRL